jgi:hypothetical protein
VIKLGPGYTRLRAAAEKVSPSPARSSYVQHGEVAQGIRNRSVSDRGNPPQPRFGRRRRGAG